MNEGREGQGGMQELCGMGAVKMGQVARVKKRSARVSVSNEKAERSSLT